MKKVLVIVPYFGKLPDYFDLWLDSARYNNNINWLLFTDDTSYFDYPPNVTVNYCTFASIKDKIQKNFNFKINLENPYKLCDFRPAYGEIFSEYLEGVHYWGYCDLDLIFGDINMFIRHLVEDEKYDRLYTYGHFSLIRNTHKTNSAYKHKVLGHPYYTEVFSSPDFYHFDEMNGMTPIFNDLNLKQFYEEDMCDINSFYFPLRLVINKHSKLKNYKCQQFRYQSGKVYRLYKSGKKLLKDEFLYFHFQKRKIRYIPTKDQYKDYRLGPDCFADQSIYISPSIKSILFFYKKVIIRILKAVKKRVS